MRTASDPLRASRKRIAELGNLGNVDLDRLGRLVDLVVDRFFTRETLTRSSHSIRVDERSVHKRTKEPPSVREEMSRHPAPRTKSPDVPSGAKGCSAAITAPPTSRHHNAGDHRPCVTPARARAAIALDEAQ
jgi:hypothetical protein